MKSLFCSLIIIVFISLHGCEDTIIQPDLDGSLVGYVYTFDEYARVSNDHSQVSVTVLGKKSHETFTDNTGRFEFRDLPAGTYEMHIEKAGFGTLKQFGIKHLGGEPTILGLNMGPTHNSEAFFIYQLPTAVIQSISIENDTVRATFAFTGPEPENMQLNITFSADPNFEISPALYSGNYYLTRSQGQYKGRAYTQYMPFYETEVYFKGRILNRCFSVLDFGRHVVRGIDSFYDYDNHTTVYPNLGDESTEFSAYLPQ